MSVQELVVSAFRTAAIKYPQVHKSWINASFRIGALLPKSRLSVSIQQSGDIDMVLRCLEDEAAAILPKKVAAEALTVEDIAVSYQLNLSGLWIGSMYEVCRLLISRSLVTNEPKLEALHHELRLIRVPLEKHEIAGDKKLKAALEFVPHPRHKDDTSSYMYDPGDRRKSHIMPMGLSKHGSPLWQVFDIRDQSSYWIERRSISDRFLELWNATAT